MYKKVAATLTSDTYSFLIEEAEDGYGTLFHLLITFARFKAKLLQLSTPLTFIHLESTPALYLIRGQRKVGEFCMIILAHAREDAFDLLASSLARSDGATYCNNRPRLVDIRCLSTVKM